VRATEGHGKYKKKGANATCFNCGCKRHLSCDYPGVDAAGADTNTNLQDGDQDNKESQTGEQLLIDAFESNKFDEEVHFSFHIVGHSEGHGSQDGRQRHHTRQLGAASQATHSGCFFK